MPVYVYRCVKCQHQFEKSQSVKDAPETTCPQCQHALRKVFCPPGIVFRAKGFYSSDNGRGGSRR